jgi:hypothetical protein
MAFFDAQHGLIGYQNTSTQSPVFYVMNFDQALLQAIQLKINQQINLSFVAYYPATQQMLFKSVNHANNQSRLFLYAANRPSLSIVSPSGRLD